MMKARICFCCKVQGHILRNCPEKGKGKEAVKIKELEEELKKLMAEVKKVSGEGQANGSKMALLRLEGCAHPEQYTAISYYWCK